jgi:hypothetical protein
MTPTPGMINSVLKPVSDYTETTSPSNPIPVPSKTMTKDNINAHGENKKPASKIPPHDMVTPLITKIITEMTGINFGKMIDDVYIVGGGIEINSQSLWNYQTIHALCVKKHLAKLAYRKFGSDAFKGNTIDGQQRIYLGAIWLVAEAPLYLQGKARKTRERIDEGAPIKAVGFSEPVFIETFKHYLTVGLQLFYQEMKAVSKVTPS